MHEQEPACIEFSKHNGEFHFVRVRSNINYREGQRDGDAEMVHVSDRGRVLHQGEESDFVAKRMRT